MERKQDPYPKFLQIWEKVDLALLQEIGGKLILYLAVIELGLKASVFLPK